MVNLSAHAAKRDFRGWGRRGRRGIVLVLLPKCANLCWRVLSHGLWNNCFEQVFLCAGIGFPRQGQPHKAEGKRSSSGPPLLHQRSRFLANQLRFAICLGRRRRQRIREGRGVDRAEHLLAGLGIRFVIPPILSEWRRCAIGRYQPDPHKGRDYVSSRCRRCEAKNSTSGSQHRFCQVGIA